ncbi:hypothetical protein [Flammeovirga aprica]|uniref:Ricin B lectin domain-containing protein n=1 Tax=Flammeovirga aprica JL-4 TaxID=694437 RepID=A0A7X9XCH1_9BACT|nr:hypothetical protein [Flammeovirga aprica]NME71725.1 hypothetical protein [Flammeovirga aprica JL-4]
MTKHVFLFALMTTLLSYAQAQINPFANTIANKPLSGLETVGNLDDFSFELVNKNGKVLHITEENKVFFLTAERGDFYGNLIFRTRFDTNHETGESTLEYVHILFGRHREIAYRDGHFMRRDNSFDEAEYTDNEAMKKKSESYDTCDFDIKVSSDGLYCTFKHIESGKYLTMLPANSKGVHSVALSSKKSDDSQLWKMRLLYNGNQI